MPTGYTTVTGNLFDSSGNPISNATAYFQPCNLQGQPISYQIDELGSVMSSVVTTAVTSGEFTIQLADTTLTKPINICYLMTVIDNVTGRQMLGPGYLLQPSGSTWNFNQFQPSVPGNPLIQTGPDGLTAYQVWLAAGNTGSQTDFFNSLKGASYLYQLVAKSDAGGTDGTADYNATGSEDMIFYSGTGNLSLYHVTGRTALYVFNSGTRPFAIVAPFSTTCMLKPSNGVMCVFDGTVWRYSDYIPTPFTPNTSPVTLTYDLRSVIYQGPANGIVTLPTSGYSSGIYTIINNTANSLTIENADGSTFATLDANKAMGVMDGNGVWFQVFGTDFGTSSGGGTGTTYNVFTSSTVGLVPAPGAGDSTRYLGADAEWHEIPSGGNSGVEVTGTTTGNTPGNGFRLVASNIGGTAALVDATIPSVNAPQLGCFDPANSPFAYLSFAATPVSAQYAYLLLTCPANWTGSDISLSFAAPTATTGNVSFRVEVAIVNPGSGLTGLSFGVAATITQVVSSTAGGMVTSPTASNFVVPSSPGAGAGSVLAIRISRLNGGTDTLADEARLIGYTLTTRVSS